MLKLLNDLKNYEVKKFHDKKLLKLYNRKDTFLNDKFLLGKGEYAIPKSYLPSHFRAKELFQAVIFYLIYNNIIYTYTSCLTVL
jgi:hypothetical protein